MIIDTHAHLNFEDFSVDYQSIIEHCLRDGVWVINVGSQLATSQRAVALAEECETGMYAAVGLHPIHVRGSSFRPEEFVISDYQTLIDGSKKIVAIGETGIDFFHDDNTLTAQEEVFRAHIALARANNLPVIIHGRNSKDSQRNAYEKILGIVRSEKWGRGVIHCFGGTVAEAKAFIDLGFYIGFTGIITFPKTAELVSVASTIPLERILIETDAPYLAPVPHRGKRNIPPYVEFVGEKIAEIRGIDSEVCIAQTVKNAKELFAF